MTTEERSAGDDLLQAVLTHTEAEGTLLAGTARGDGSAELLKPLGWRWGRSLRAWFLPRSRDAVPQRALIERTAAVLREAGFDVEVGIDTSPTDWDEREQRFVQRAQARAQRLTRRADHHQDLADTHAAAARRIMGGIPLGQPILIGTAGQARVERNVRRVEGHHRVMFEHGQAAEAARQAAAAASASTGARNAPATVANRIRRLQAEVGKLERELEALVSASGDPERTRLVDQLRLARADLAHWQEVRVVQIETGTVANHSPETVRPGDQVKVRGIWRTVVRANPKSVTVTTDSSANGTVPWHHVQAHHPGCSGG